MTEGVSQARVLVVDDDALSRALLVGFLRAEGYEVIGADDGPRALAVAPAFLPDVVLLDVMMPGMSGFEVCRALKAAPETRLSQVMLVTALDGTLDRVAGLDTGADDYETKPVRRESFLAKVRALLRARQLLVDLESARERLAERNRELELKKLLSQTLVHDLKSPLSAALGNLDLLELRADETMRPLIRRCHQSTARILKMVLNLLDVDGLEEGRLIPARTTVDAVQILRETLDEAQPMARQAGVTLVLDAPSRAAAAFDPHLLRRVLDNLVSNAVSHSPSGGRVQLRLRVTDDATEIDVGDEGPGIPEEHRQRIFEKYVQLSERNEIATANRGLGLTFCKLAVEAHGGSIVVDGAADGGAIFRTCWPVVAGELAGVGSDGAS